MISLVILDSNLDNATCFAFSETLSASAYFLPSLTSFFALLYRFVASL